MGYRLKKYPSGKALAGVRIGQLQAASSGTLPILSLITTTHGTWPPMPRVYGPKIPPRPNRLSADARILDGYVIFVKPRYAMHVD